VDGVTQGPTESPGIGLADFLTDLRSELATAQERAAGQVLRLGVDEIVVSLEVAVTRAQGGEAGAGVKAKFWVLELGEASGRATMSRQRAQTQTLTLTLRPRLDREEIDAVGEVKTRSQGLDVESAFGDTEERPGMSRVGPRSSPSN
jgi:hypothetical protein